MSRFSVFITSIKEARVEDVNVNSIVNAAVVCISNDGSKIDIKTASGITIKELLVRASHLGNCVEIGNFKLTDDGIVTGTGQVAIKDLLVGGECKAVAIAQIKRAGENKAVGYVMCSREGKAGQLTKEKAIDYIKNNGYASVQNLKLSRPGYGRADFVSAQEVDKLPSYIVGVTPTQTEKTETKRKEAPIRDEKNLEKKRAALKKLSGTNVGAKLSEEYDYDAIMFIVRCAKKRRKYEYLLNPAYTVGQMRVLQSGYRDGLDISQFNNPSLSEREMMERKDLMKLGVWYNVATGRL